MGNRVISLILDRFEPTLALLERLGLKDPIKNIIASTVGVITLYISVIMTAAWAVWLHIYENVPLWALPLIFFTTISLLAVSVIWVIYWMLRLVQQWSETRNQLSLDPKRYREIGVQLIEISREMLRAKEEWEEYHPTRMMQDPFDNAQDSHQKRIDNGRIILSKFRYRFEAEYLHLLENIKILGINKPNTLHFFSTSDIDQLVRYFALIGKLLSNDQLDDARKLGEDDFWMLRL